MTGNFKAVGFLAFWGKATLESRTGHEISLVSGEWKHITRAENN